MGSRRTVKVSVTLTFTVDVDARVTDDEVRESVDREVNRYSDGRYSFDSEMFRNGGAGVVNAGVGYWLTGPLMDRLAKRCPALDPTVTYDAWERRRKLEDTFVGRVHGGTDRDVIVSIGECAIMQPKEHDDAA